MTLRPYVTPKMASYVAGEDLSLKQYTFVKFHTTTGQVVGCSVAGEAAIGILQNAPEENEAADVALIGGGAKLKVDAGISAGDLIMTGADGKGELTSLASGHYVAAMADAVGSTDSSADDVIPVILLASSGERKFLTGTITSAEILALNATPKTLIPAPGANKAIIVEEIQLFLDYESAAYAADAGEDFTIEYSGGTDIGVIDNDAVTFLEASADAHWIGKPQALYDVQAAGSGDGVLLSGFDNEAVQASIATGEVITGDSPIKWKITYRVVDYLT